MGVRVTWATCSKVQLLWTVRTSGCLCYQEYHHHSSWILLLCLYVVSIFDISTDTTVSICSVFKVLACVYLWEVCMMYWYVLEVTEWSLVSSCFCAQWEHSLSSLVSQVCLWHAFSRDGLCSLSLYLIKDFLSFGSFTVVRYSVTVTV